jgi:3-keto-5-aminohexanoate cleavage enzyme
MSVLRDELAKPVPIVLAPTGMIPTKAMTPHVPITPAEIADDVSAAVAFGISAVHLHARDEDGVPTWEREVYADIITRIRDRHPDLVINVSTSGRTFAEIEKRADVLALDGDIKPEVASLTMSSLNFLDGPSVNAPATIRALATIMRDRDIVPELEIFDLGMVNFAHVLQREGILVGDFPANIFLGNIAGIQATPAELGLAVDRLPAAAHWNGAGLGDAQTSATMMALAAGGGVRVGLEDGIYLDHRREELATNAALVERVHQSIQLLGRRVMTPAEYRVGVLGR